MTGRAEVARLEKQLDAAFQRVKGLGPAADIEVQSDFARYLCVLVSGYLEKSVAELMLPLRSCVGLFGEVGSGTHA